MKFTGYHLKIIAFVTMVIDHIATVTLTATNIKSVAEESDKEIIECNGTEYEIIEESKEEVVVESEQDGYVCESTYDKGTNEINIICSEDGFFFDKKVGNYTINVINFNQSENILECDVIDNETGEVFHVSDSEIQAQLPWVAGCVIGEIVYALLIYCATVCVYEGVEYVALSISEIRKQNYYCYCALLYNGAVLIGPALTYKEAVVYAKATKNVNNVGVFCGGSDAKAKAKKIAKAATKDGNIVYHSAHDTSEGFYQNYHPANSSGKALHFHSWYCVY